MALTIPHPSHTGSRSASIFMSGAVIVAVLAFAGTQVVDFGDDGSSTGSVVETTDAVDTSTAAASATAIRRDPVGSLAASAPTATPVPGEPIASAATSAPTATPVPGEPIASARFAGGEALGLTGGEALGLEILNQPAAVHPLTQPAATVTAPQAHPLTQATGTEAPAEVEAHPLTQPTG